MNTAHSLAIHAAAGLVGGFASAVAIDVRAFQSTAAFGVPFNVPLALRRYAMGAVLGACSGAAVWAAAVTSGQ